MRRKLCASSSSSLTALLPPTVLYSDNHLLVVNKPVGWHSVPNLEESPKCLLTELKRMKLGGGSQNDFLASLHRIDQPCSGVLLVGKTSKAAGRITTLWKEKRVEKEYLCVVSAPRLHLLEQASSSSSKRGWHTLQGLWQPRPSRDVRSVVILPISPSKSGKPVELSWRLMEESSNLDYGLVRVQTNAGARHVVRAMLAQVGRCPIVGDVRYNSNAKILKDQSVALHAHRVTLDNRLKLGSLQTFQFEAPIPDTWNEYFGITQKSLAHN